MILEMPPEMAAQVVFGKYVELSGLVFSGDSIQMMVDRNLPRVLGSSYRDEAAIEQARAAHGPIGDSLIEQGDWGLRYATGVDFGRQTDFTVITTLDCRFRPAKLVYWRRLNRVPWEAIYGEVGLARQLFGSNILIDGSGPAGDVVLDALESRAWCPRHQQTVMLGGSCERDGKPNSGCSSRIYLSLACCDPYIFSAQRKKELVEHLRNVMQAGYSAKNPSAPYGQIRVPPIAQLEEELSFYAWEDKKLQTDCVFSLALAAWAGLEDARPDPYGGSTMGI